MKNYKLNSLTHVLELYKFYNELVELIIHNDLDSRKNIRFLLPRW